MMWLNFEMTSSRISANPRRPKIPRKCFIFFSQKRGKKQQLARHDPTSIGDDGDGDGHRDDDAVPPDWGG